MSRVVTVRGDVDPADLGFTSMHDHVFSDNSFFREIFKLEQPDLAAMARVAEDEPLSLGNLGAVRRNPWLLRDEVLLDDEEHMAAEVAEYFAAGGQSILEVTAPGTRIKTAALARLSEETGVHIVASTGLYAEPSWPERFKTMTLKEIAAYMSGELLEGIEDSGIRAGHIKVGIVDISPQQETVLRAAARVSNELGVAVTVHPGFGIGNDGRTVVRILRSEGMDLSRLIIAHTSTSLLRTQDVRARALYPEATNALSMDYAEELIQAGAALCFDCFGHSWEFEYLRERQEEDWQRFGGLVALLRKGLAERLVLGNDIFLKSLTRRYGGDGYKRLPEGVVPLLRDLGVSEYAVRLMTIDNPARLLAW